MMPDSIHGTKLNKGEWAELYVMLKVLGDGKLFSADNHLIKQTDNYLDVIKIIREEEQSHELDYAIDNDDGVVHIIEANTNKVAKTIPQKLFSYYADMLFHELQCKTGRAIEASDEICNFATTIGVVKPKAPAVKSLAKQFGGKNDIFMQVRDSQTALVSVMGFSIKSKFASNPTLFNAGSSSQILFKLNNADDSIMHYFNEISDGKTRGWSSCKHYLKNNDINLEFVGTSNPIYNNNLVLVRDSMPQIMAWAVKDRLIDSDGAFEVKETVERMAKANPLGVSNPVIYYEKAIKDFLMAGFTGMTAGRAWDGREQVNGGYIVVTNTGAVLCYHASDREAFRDYLFKNTYFEYVSTSKYKWGYISKVNGEYILPLNISVRFRSNTR